MRHYAFHSRGDIYVCNKYDFALNIKITVFAYSYA